jgi:hypothetical protein
METNDEWTQTPKEKIISRYKRPKKSKKKENICQK